MVDHQRMDALTALIERSGAKLIAVGDGRQLPAIGPGGMFDRLALHAPTAELADVHRTLDPAERKAWAALRAGEPERAMAHYRAQGRLHFADTRDQAGERAVKDWARLLDHHDPRQVALIADASNIEIDRLNARAQHLRAERGELASRRDPAPRPPLRAPRRRPHHLHRPTPPARSAADRERSPRPGHRHPRRTRTRLTVSLDGSERQLRLAGEQLSSLRLAYAQHVYRQQGATVERAIIITGGWQTSRESAYVQAIPRPQRQRLVPRARRARPRRPRRATDRAARGEDARQSPPCAVAFLPRDRQARISRSAITEPRPTPV